MLCFLLGVVLSAAGWCALAGLAIRYLTRRLRERPEVKQALLDQVLIPLLGTPPATLKPSAVNREQEASS
jgi:hypothetical protein